MAGVIRPGMTIYDVGANAGFYTLLFARLTGPLGRVIAFEPFPENAANLLDHISMNRLDNVILVQAPLSARRELASFHAGASSSMGALSEVETPLRMLTVTIDELIASYGVPQPDVVKMDVEGAESDVLRGAKQLLAGRNAVWFISLHGEAQRRACTTLFTDAGYHLSSLVGNGNTSWTDAADEIIAMPEARKQG
ncbi:MAG: FkbM family methyltransferase [Candidatus Binatia bacterium]